MGGTRADAAEKYAENVVAGTVPRYLYKYRSLAGASRAYTRDLIINQRLYFPAPAELNDPFECRPRLHTTANLAQQRRYLIGLVNRTHRGVPRGERRRMINEIAADKARFRETMLSSTNVTLSASGIYSLSARHTDLLMWPHYADNHRGVCVRFEMQALMDAGLVPFPVVYADQRPTCDTILDGTVDWLNKAVLTKGSPWAYEEEWRLVENRGARKTVQLVHPTINGVLLGANVSPEDREEVLAWVKACNRPMGVAQTRFHEDVYALEIDNIHPSQ